MSARRGTELTAPDTTLAHPARKRKSVVAAVVASMVFPGLGHLYLGRRRSAAMYALPVLVLLAIVLLRVLSDGLDVLGIEMFAPSTSLTVLGIIVALGLWWLIALLDAFTAAGGRSVPRPPRSPACWPS